MKLSLEAKLIAVFAFLAAIVLLLAWKTHLNNRNYQDSFRDIERTNMVLLAAEETASCSKDLERGVRGYLITGDPMFLRPFLESGQAVLEKLGELKALTAGNPTQQKRIDSLRFYLDKRIGFLEQSLVLEKTQGFEAAKKFVQTRGGNTYMEKVMNVIGKLKENERSVLKAMKEANIASNRAFNTTFLSLLALLVTVLFAFFINLYFSYKRRNQTQALLTENKNLLQSIVDNTSSIIYLKDLQGRFMLVNRQFEKTFNIAKKDVIGKTVFDFWAAEFAIQYSDADQVVFQQGKLVEVEEDTEIDGQLHNFYSIKFPLYHQNGELYALAGISTDITNILNKQQLVQQKEIAETTFQAQEKERTEIGKELHDNVNQLLATARLMIETSLTMPEMQSECMAVSKSAVEDAIKEIRAISHSMLPPPFEDEAFADAIKDIAHSINIIGNLKVEVQMPTAEKLSTIDNGLKLSLYRIIQEQVSNMLKYSNAKTACIRLEVKNDHAHLSIVDNGIGADLGKQPKGVGLRNIASRVEVHNGELKIKTAPNEGFGLYTRFFIANSNGKAIA